LGAGGASEAGKDSSPAFEILPVYGRSLGTAVQRWQAIKIGAGRAS
jgi:hypothetical protein